MCTADWLDRVGIFTGESIRWILEIEYGMIKSSVKKSIRGLVSSMLVFERSVAPSENEDKYCLEFSLRRNVAIRTESSIALGTETKSEK